MPAGLTSTVVVNEALQHTASQATIISLSDGSGLANAAQIIYGPTVQILLRELDPDFARATVALLPASGTPPPPWAFEYVYPVDCIRVRQIRPAAASIVDPFDPSPVRAQVLFDPTISAKVICTNQASALAVYTTSLVTETQWDSAFADAVVRRLANPLNMAEAGRPDFAVKLLEQSAMMARTAEQIDEGGFRRF